MSWIWCNLHHCYHKFGEGHKRDKTMNNIGFSGYYLNNLKKQQRKTTDDQINDYREVIIGSHLPRIKPKSFDRWADKNCKTKNICLNYLSNRGQTIDQIVFDLNETHGEGYFCEQDIIDFILKYETYNPYKRK